jgi:hypothetical protein
MSLLVRSTWVAMSAPVPSIEPTNLTAGDTVTWSRSLADYPATQSWVLSYRLINAANKIDITAAASGADHLVTVTAATSAAWQAGTYTWQAYVTKAAERYTVGAGSVVIKPNLAAQAAGFDSRSESLQRFDAIKAAYDLYIANGQGLMQRYTIGGREVWFKDFDDAKAQLDYWGNKVQAELAAESIAAGRGNPRRAFAMFTR